MSAPSHTAIAGNESVLIETVTLGALITGPLGIRLQSTDISEQRKGGNMHTFSNVLYGKYTTHSGTQNARWRSS